MFETEVFNYVNCALSMRERLENIHISRGINERSNLEYQRLYNNLNQFSNLVDIYISRETDNGLQVLEYVVESCRSLKNITLSLNFVNNLLNSRLPNVDNFVAIRSRYNPKLNIKSLNITTNGPLDYNLILYIVHKFPSLREYLFTQHMGYPHFNIYLITLLLEYISTIDKFIINGISLNQDDLVEIICNFWKKTATPGSENIKIVYSEDPLEISNAALRIFKHYDRKTNTINLIYPVDIMDLQRTTCMSFIQENGIFIGSMDFIIDVEDGLPHQGRCELPGNLILHILLYCPNLQTLCITGCILNSTEVNFSKRSTISKLHLNKCHSYPNMLQNLSQAISVIGQLHLEDTFNYTPQDESSTTDTFELDIIMPYTSINCITIGGILEYESVYLKLFVGIEQKFYYYLLKLDVIEIINEKMFAKRANIKQLRVSCFIKPSSIEVAMRSNSAI